MRKSGLFNSIINVFIICVLAGFLTAAIDYFRMKSGEVPIINVNTYDEKRKVQTFKGIFYRAERKVATSPKEPLVDSSNMKFAILVFDLNVPKNFNDDERDYSIKTKEVGDCQENAKLYYADENIKVYTYCLESIDIKEKKKTMSLDKFIKNDATILDEIDANMSYLGLVNDSSTLKFKDYNNVSNNGLSMYKCHKTNINDVYFAPQSVDFQPDFCTYKDDDFKFISKIQEEPKNTSDGLEKQKEVIYEDAQYRYEFDEIKSDRIFIVTPAVRGKTEMRYPLKQIIGSNMLTMDELAAKGLKFNKIDKIKEQEAVANQTNQNG